MSDDDTGTDRETFASAFDRSLDPLDAHEDTFERIDADPFELFVEQALQADDPTPRTVSEYRTAVTQWREYMARQGRHPACPSEAHVQEFAGWLQAEKDNRAVATIRQKLDKLGRIYRFWQAEAGLPHDREFDPIRAARARLDRSEFQDTPDKPPHPLPRDELRAVLDDIPTIRDHAYIATQLKLGLRVGELCNIQLQDIALHIEPLQAQYPELGTHDALSDSHRAIYIPSKHERDGNKSDVGRLLPLDDELHSILVQYHLIRPTIGLPWVYLSAHHTQSTPKDVNRAWKDAFQPDYDETANCRAVTSHYGRHYFTTYWKNHQQLPVERLQYMRGDAVGEPADDTSTMHDYLHAYYQDIEPRYRQDIYTLTFKGGSDTVQNELTESARK